MGGCPVIVYLPVWKDGIVNVLGFGHELYSHDGYECSECRVIRSVGILYSYTLYAVYCT